MMLTRRLEKVAADSRAQDSRGVSQDRPEVSSASDTEKPFKREILNSYFKVSIIPMTRMTKHLHFTSCKLQRI